jgi:hypothetical protein
MKLDGKSMDTHRLRQDLQRYRRLLADLTDAQAIRLLKQMMRDAEARLALLRKQSALSKQGSRCEQ